MSEVVNNVKMAIDAFEIADSINGTLSGGIDPPRFILGIEAPDEFKVNIRWKHPRLGGLSDCIYHYKDTSEHTDTYRVVCDKLLLNDSVIAFDTAGLKECEALVEEFYKRWKLVA